MTKQRGEEPKKDKGQKVALGQEPVKPTPEKVAQTLFAPVHRRREAKKKEQKR